MDVVCNKGRRRWAECGVDFEDDLSRKRRIWLVALCVTRSAEVAADVGDYHHTRRKQVMVFIKVTVRFGRRVSKVYCERRDGQRSAILQSW